MEGEKGDTTADADPAQMAALNIALNITVKVPTVSCNVAVKFSALSDQIALFLAATRARRRR